MSENSYYEISDYKIGDYKLNEYKIDNYEIGNYNYIKLFGKNQILEFKLLNPVRRSPLITYLRKIGDLNGQYVTNVYYLDTLFFYNYDVNEIYSTYNYYFPVYSTYHSECEYCKKHELRLKKNLIVGYKIYPKGIIPEKTYKQRKLYWKNFL